VNPTVTAPPVDPPRQRAGVFGGHVRNYTRAEHAVQAYKAPVMLAARQAGVNKPMEGPLCVDIDFYLPRPKRLMRKKDPAGPIPHTARPDRDNLEKATTDALKGLAWRDDSQICDGRVRKWYAEKDGVPRVEIKIGRASCRERG